MKIIYCPLCNKETEGEVINKQEVFKVKGEDIIVSSSIIKCRVCGENVFDEELDEKNIINAYSEYRKKHFLLTPSQIKGLREKYSLSQRALSTLLEWGEITIHRYESGGIQDKAHDEVLLFINNPENMNELYERNGHLLSNYTQLNLKSKIDELLNEEIKPKFDIALEYLLKSNKKEDEFTGYVEYNLEKIKNLILYIINNVQDTYKTNLNKILWYTDFLHFKEYSTSITGSSYTHLPFGPTFDDYELILGAMFNDNSINKVETVFKKNISGELLKSTQNCDEKIFNETEIKVINIVTNNCKNFTCKQISDYSHKEEAYKHTSNGEKISYLLAESLSLNI